MIRLKSEKQPRRAALRNHTRPAEAVSCTTMDDAAEELSLAAAAAAAATAEELNLAAAATAIAAAVAVFFTNGAVSIVGVNIKEVSTVGNTFSL